MQKILELKAKYEAHAANIKSLNDLLESESFIEQQDTVTPLVSVKNQLLIDAKLGSDNAAQIADIEKQIAKAQKADELNNDRAKQNHAFIHSIKERIEVETAAMNTTIANHNAAAVEYFAGEIDKKESELQAAQTIVRQRTFEIAALEGKQAEFGRKDFLNVGFSTVNNGRCIELWRKNGANEKADAILKPFADKEVELLSIALKNQGIEVLK